MKHLLLLSALSLLLFTACKKSDNTPKYKVKYQTTFGPGGGLKQIAYKNESGNIDTLYPTGLNNTVTFELNEWPKKGSLQQWSSCPLTTLVSYIMVNDSLIVYQDSYESTYVVY